MHIKPTVPCSDKYFFLSYAFYARLKCFSRCSSQNGRFNFLTISIFTSLYTPLVLHLCMQQRWWCRHLLSSQVKFGSCAASSPTTTLWKSYLQLLVLYCNFFLMYLSYIHELNKIQFVTFSSILVDKAKKNLVDKKLFHLLFLIKKFWTFGKKEKKLNLDLIFFFLWRSSSLGPAFCHMLWDALKGKETTFFLDKFWSLLLSLLNIQKLTTYFLSSQKWQ